MKLETEVVGAPTNAYHPIKRAADFIFAVFLLIITLPLTVAIAIAIQLESAGPILFNQERIGFKGRPFTIHKFRSMSALSPRYSYKVPIGDPRITRVGRFIRRTGLDELPQLWNVIRGEMSLIGPRPELPFIVEQYEPIQHIRHAVRPGITGWWQIHQRNTPKTMQEDSADPAHLSRLAYDLYYLENIGLKLDFGIAVTTARLMVDCVLHPNRGSASELGSLPDGSAEAGLLVAEATARKG